MMERSAWPWMLIVASLLPWVEPAACAAQPPTGATATTNPSPPAQVATFPPSTVSPAIERFMRRSGQNLPQPPPLAVPATIQNRAVVALSDAAVDGVTGRVLPSRPAGPRVAASRPVADTSGPRASGT